MIRAIAAHEFRRLFLSPLAWVIAAIFQVALAWVLLEVLQGFTGLEAGQRQAGLTHEVALHLYGFAAVLALMFMPLLTMRLFSDEYRSGSFSLLASSPVSLIQILLGKYLGILGYLCCLLLLPTLMSLSLSIGTEIDPGRIAAALLALALAMAAFAAIGLYASALTNMPSVAAVTAYGISLLLSLIGRVDRAEDPSSWLFSWLSWNEHYFYPLLGLMRSVDIAYFLLIIGTCLAFALRHLEQRRTRI